MRCVSDSGKTSLSCMYHLLFLYNFLGRISAYQSVSVSTYQHYDMSMIHTLIHILIRRAPRLGRISGRRRISRITFRLFDTGL